tara:strand:- start:6972 stop:7340 length:369 start_codon:yes stop_codon:yes gene_type:complete
MEKTNKIIAEFMQKSFEGFGLYDYNGKHYKLYELKFHTSWDWLMPVIHKCFDVAEDGQMADIMHYLQVAEIDSIYKAVLEFIKEQKETEYKTCDKCSYDNIDDNGDVLEHYCEDDELYTPNN